MRRIAMGVVLLFTVGTFARADDASHRQAALRLLEVSQARGVLDQMLDSMDTVIEQQFEALDLSEEGREAVEQRRSEMHAWLTEALDWESMSEFLVATYVELFTESELEELGDFYASPLGQKMIQTMPAIMQRSMQWGAMRVQQVMPELERRMQTMSSELEEEYGSEG